MTVQRSNLGVVPMAHLVVPQGHRAHPRHHVFVVAKGVYGMV